MAKKKITEAQWDEILNRQLSGESMRSIAKDYGITEGAIRKKIGTHSKQIKSVANQIVKVERTFEALPFGTQIKVRTLADKLKAISNHMAGAAEYGAATAHRLSQIANAQVEKIDAVNPEQSMTELRTIASMQDTANKAAMIASGLIKEYGSDPVRDIEEEPVRKMTKQEIIEELRRRGLPEKIYAT